MGTRRTTIGSIALAGAVTMVLCGTAAGAVTARSASLSVPGFEVVSTTASCAAGERVSMAGFSGQVNDTQATFLTALAPTVTGVKVASGNPGAAGTMSVTAYCDKPATAKKKKKKKKKGKGKSASTAKKKGKKKKKKKAAPPPIAVSATAPIDGPGNTGSTTVTCPAGTTVRAGGFDTNSSTDDTYHLTGLEQTSPTQVTASVAHYGGTTDPKSLTAIALCGQGAPLAASPGPAAQMGAPKANTSTATCASGKLGWIGYKRGPFNTVYATGIARVSDTSGTVSGYGSSSDSVQAIAYCG